jgi:uncharacterized phage protein (TIGR01671 family)
MSEYKYRAYFDGEMLYNAVRLNNALYWNEGQSFDLLAFKQKKPAILMEHTSLRDKNNTEIYEADVVAKFDFESPYFKSVVVRHLAAFGYVNCGDFIAFASNYHFNWNNNQSNKILVIGNIHESPELAKQIHNGRGLHNQK